MVKPETRRNQELPPVTELGFNALVDNLTYHTSARYRDEVAKQLQALDPNNEDQLLKRSYLEFWAEPATVIVSTVRFWQSNRQQEEGDTYAQFNEDFRQYLKDTDFVDEPEHQITKERLLEKPLTTTRQFERLMKHVNRNHRTPHTIGRSVVHRFLRQG